MALGWTFLVLMAAVNGRAETDWVILPGTSVGRIKASWSERDLRREFGPDSVILDPDLPTGAMLVPYGDASSALNITWCDRKKRRGICEVEAALGSFRWKTHHGLEHGMTVADVEQLNGGPLTVGPSGQVAVSTGRIAELGATLFLTFKSDRTSSWPEQILKRYTMGPPWSSSHPEMRPFAQSMRLIGLRVVLRPATRGG